jgi:hypothetical protein
LDYGADMDEAIQAALFRKYLAGEATQAQELLLQAWHEDHGHAEADPVNGSCFCCCEDCYSPRLEQIAGDQGHLGGQ